MDGLPNGDGKFSFVDGSEYNGRFENGTACGFGSYVTPTGIVQRGVFDKLGSLHGPGLHAHSHSKIVAGEFRHGSLWGNGVEFANDGSMCARACGGCVVCVPAPFPCLCASIAGVRALVYVSACLCTCMCVQCVCVCACMSACVRARMCCVDVVCASGTESSCGYLRWCAGLCITRWARVCRYDGGFKHGNRDGFGVHKMPGIDAEYKGWFTLGAREGRSARSTRVPVHARVCVFARAHACVKCACARARFMRECLRGNASTPALLRWTRV